MEINFEIERKNFIFAEVEENEVGLEKLKHWQKKMQKRDVFEVTLKKAAMEKIKGNQVMVKSFMKNSGF